MKAARYHEKGQLVVEKVDVQKPQAGEVLIKVAYCGICGTDVQIFHGHKGSMEVVPPKILGHEFSGHVEKVGDGVTHVKAGDRVSADVNYSCGYCDACTEGNPHFCDDMKGVGTYLDGAFAEYITVPANAVFPIPANVSLQAASMVEPISCCLHGIDLTDIQLGDRVMVVGTGSIGLIMVQLAKHAGASTVIAVEPSAPRLALAGKLGADVLINPAEQDAKAALEEAGVKRVDKVIDCAGTVGTAEFSVDIAGKGATVMLFGLTAPDETMQLKPYTVFAKELTIRSSFVNPQTFARAIRVLEAGIISTDEIITDIYPLDDIQMVFEEKLYAKNGKTIINTFKDQQ